MENFITKDGRQLLIRKMVADDYEQAVLYLRKVSTETKFLNQYPGQPDLPREKAVKGYESDSAIFYAAFDKDGQIVGVVNLMIGKPEHPWISKAAEFGISVLKEYHSSGLGTRLMELMEEWGKNKGIHCITGRVRSTNRKAMGLYLKQGFNICGLIRECAFIDGIWHDEYVIQKLI